MIYRFSRIITSPETHVVGQKNVGFRSDVEREFPLIQLHDPDSPDIAFAINIAEEMINISGALVEVYQRTDNNSYDDVWEEDPDPTYKSGVKLKGYFVPQPIAVQLTPWGLDAPNQTTIMFSRKRILQEFGEKRMIRAGDIIQLPYDGALLRPQRYRVLNSADAGNFRYTWLYFSCIVESITDDETLDISHK